MNEKPCEVERRRGKGGERISCYQGNRHHGNYLINELLMNPTNMALVKSCCSNYQSFIHPVLAGAARAAWSSLQALTDGREQLAESMERERVPGSVLHYSSEPAPRALKQRPHAVQSIFHPHTAKGQPSWPRATGTGSIHKQSAEPALLLPAMPSTSRRRYRK